MPLFPLVDSNNTQQDVIDTFYGYDHQLKIADGEWYDTQNLTTDFAPMMANRKKRRNLNIAAAALAEKDALAYISTSGDLYYNFTATGITGLDMTKVPKQLVSMGAYLCIFPDKKYFNTEDPTDYGSMEANFTGSATYALVRYDGTAVSPTVSATEPQNPTNGLYWLDTSGEKHILKQWSDAQEMWVTVETCYVKITFADHGAVESAFKPYDGVTISDASVDLNGDKIIYDCGDDGSHDWIMVTGLIDSIPGSAETITIKREVPDMDYVCECQNRLWGCFYGRRNGENYNEIYCCALGDFKNWRQYIGLSTDSWTGSVGSDGQWTGAISYLGHPTFFKENRIHTVTISTEGAHRINETVCRGVQKGSWQSLAVVNETLYYKSRTDICAYQGSFPTGISAALGSALYHDAVAGAVGGKYYISMQDENDQSSLFVYDINKGIWVREDSLNVSAFARVDDELYAVAGDSIRTMLGSVPGSVSGTALESEVEWEAISGIEYYNHPEHKRVSRYNIRLKLAQGASIKAFVQYDSSGVWENAGEYFAETESVGTILFPVRPHRCDHLQIKLTGEGDVRIFSLARILEVGSDYR